MQPVRIVTSASLFDGHDAAIHVVRRLLQARGAEVIHLGHDRSVEEIASAAIQEDVQAVAVSSYQGGHMEFYRYLAERLAASGADAVRIYGGGGGTITGQEAAELSRSGVRIFGPAEGRTLGLDGMIRQILDESRRPIDCHASDAWEHLAPEAPLAVARLISWFESEREGADADALRGQLDARRRRSPAPVIGVTGTGGSGKSTLVDELLARYRKDFPERSAGVLLIDPTMRRTGGALLGDRIRMNAIHGARIFVRSMATRRAHRALSRSAADALRVFQAADFDLILLETAGIGQSDTEIVDLADVSVYVMTPEYGAPSQLEKIGMLDLADLIVLNKADRQGAEDALRDVRRHWRRSRSGAAQPEREAPVYPAIARRWNDPGVDRLYAALLARLGEGAAPARGAEIERESTWLVPPARRRYLAEIAETLRRWHAESESLALRARDVQALARAQQILASEAGEATGPGESVAQHLGRCHAAALGALPSDLRAALESWPEVCARYRAASQSYRVREREIRVENRAFTPSGMAIPKVALPRTDDWAELTRYLRRENLPGSFPFTAGVFPFRREGEDPLRMFAGEGTPERTNRRFHWISRGQRSARLSTAFDSVTLYGRDPDERPDVYGKIGNAGVSVCSVDDAVKLYSGFDLCAPTTSVSMTINGPAPIVLAFFLNAAIDQAVERFLRETGRFEAIRARLAGRDLPAYEGSLPEGHDGLGLGLLGVSSDEVVDAETYARIRKDVLHRVRGTVQADILKEDQAQNTCIFATDFALRMMGDIQEYFIAHQVENFYSVSISGYHIAEAGANPITQLAFTLANGFTYCEYYAARGMAVDDFAPNFSFFFSNGLDAEYSVIGRVARRIWAVAMRE